MRRFQNLMGGFWSGKNRTNKASKEFDDQLRALRKQAESGSPQHQFDLSQALNDYGNYLNQRGRYEESSLAFEECIPIRERLAKQASDDYTEFYARSCYSFANNLNDLENFAEAAVWATTAVAALRELVDSGNEKLIGELAAALNNLGSAHSQLGIESNDIQQIGRGAESFREAAAIRKALFESDHSQYGKLYFKSLSNFVRASIAAGRTDEAAAELQELQGLLPQDEAELAGWSEEFTGLTQIMASLAEQAGAHDFALALDLTAAEISDNEERERPPQDEFAICENAGMSLMIECFTQWELGRLNEDLIRQAEKRLGKARLLGQMLRRQQWSRSRQRNEQSKLAAVFDAAIGVKWLRVINDFAKEDAVLEILELSEASRMRALADLLAEASFTASADVPGRLLEQYRSLKRQISQVTEELNEHTYASCRRQPACRGRS